MTTLLLIWNSNPPKPHAFIETEFKSSMVYGAATLGIVAMITQHLTGLVNSCFTLDMLYETSGLATTVLINHIERIITGVIEINIRLSTDLNITGVNYITLTHIHTYLTSYITNCQYIVSLLQHYIGYSGGSVELNQLQHISTRLSDACRILLLLYRQVELTLGISLANSPIST